MRPPLGIREVLASRDQTDSRWTTVDSLRMHARVPRIEPAAGAPAVVLVHGIGVSSRYMLPVMLQMPGAAHIINHGWSSSCA